MLTTSPFDTIKEALKIDDIVAFYGVEVKRSNQALCPFHNEKTPSFTIYPKTNSFKCFGCGAGGSVIDFVMQIHGMDALDAAKKLDIDYSLGLFDHQSSQEEMHLQRTQRKANKGLDKAFKGYIDKAYSLLCDYLHLLQDWKIIYAPKAKDELDKVNHFFIEACHRLDYTEYLIDCLLNADIDEQIEFYQTHRKELQNIVAKLCENSREADKSA